VPETVSVHESQPFQALQTLPVPPPQILDQSRLVLISAYVFLTATADDILMLAPIATTTPTK
jgi:hypothetical protein